MDVKILVLYELGKSNKLSVFEITGHKKVSKDELIKLNYPNSKPRKNYMIFNIVPLDMDVAPLEASHLIEKLVDINANNSKGTPVFIEP